MITMPCTRVQQLDAPKTLLPRQTTMQGNRLRYPHPQAVCTARRCTPDSQYLDCLTIRFSAPCPPLDSAHDRLICAMLSSTAGAAGLVPPPHQPPWWLPRPPPRSSPLSPRMPPSPPSPPQHSCTIPAGHHADGAMGGATRRWRRRPPAAHADIPTCKHTNLRRWNTHTQYNKGEDTQAVLTVNPHPRMHSARSSSHPHARRR